MIDTKDSKTNLAVDGDEFVRRTAVTMRRRLGYKVLEAKDDRSALKVLSQDGKGIDP